MAVAQKQAVQQSGTLHSTSGGDPRQSVQRSSSSAEDLRSQIELGMEPVKKLSSNRNSFKKGN